MVVVLLDWVTVSAGGVEVEVTSLVVVMVMVEKTVVEVTMVDVETAETIIG